jgi:hypothetical protein
MLRLLILILLLANVLYYAWSQGQLAALGYAPATQSEPQRVKNQIKPEALKILSAEEAKSANKPADAPPPAPAPAPDAAPAAPTSQAPQGPATECLQAGIFTAPQIVALRTALDKALPAEAWALEDASENGRWLVYMGKYSDAAAVQKKLAELRSLEIAAEPLDNPTLQPGISLGNFDALALAQEKLAQLTRRGVRTARVVEDKPPVTGQRLKLPQIDEALRTRLDALKPALAGKALEACKA